MNDNELTRQEEEKYKKIWNKVEYSIYSDETEEIWKIIEYAKYKPIKKILVIGCGQGFGIHYLKRAGFDVYGLDIVNVLKFPEYKGTFTQCPIWNTNFKDYEFDLCIAVDVLEHIPLNKVDETLKEIKRIGKHFYFIISCRPDTLGELTKSTLHLTIKPPDWWMKKIKTDIKFIVEHYSGSYSRIKIHGRARALLQKPKDIVELKKPTKKKLMYVGYYTKNTPYEKEAKELIKTLEPFDLEFNIQGVPDLGTWAKNTHYKAIFIKSMLKHFADKNIVFLDVDVRLYKNPILFEEINKGDYDFAVHLIDWNKYRSNRKWKELNSSVMYFRNNEKIKKLLDKWILKNEREDKNIWEQKKLQNLIYNEGWEKELKIYTLPATYCTIFDSMNTEKDPVIKLFQASRKYRT